MNTMMNAAAIQGDAVRLLRDDELDAVNGGCELLILAGVAAAVVVVTAIAVTAISGASTSIDAINQKNGNNAPAK